MKPRSLTAATLRRKIPTQHRVLLALPSQCARHGGAPFLEWNGYTTVLGRNSASALLLAQILQQEGYSATLSETTPSRIVVKLR